MNPKKPKIVSGRVKKSPSFEAMKQTIVKATNNGGVSIDFNINVENIREVSRKLNYNILSDATFVYVPSSYSENKNFNQNPIIINKLTFSEEFDNIIWTKTNSSISANITTAPNGTLTADRLIENSSNTSHAIFITQGQIGTNLPSGTTLNFSVYGKYSGTRPFILIGITDSGDKYAWFDLTGGTFSNVNPNFSAFSENVGNGWFRCGFRYTTITNSNNIFIAASPTSGVQTYLGDGVSGMYIWGAQLESGTTATIYQRTTDGITDFNFSRATTSTVINKDLIVSDSCYNLVTFSEQFDNSAWVKINNSATPNATIAPNGTMTADKLIPNTSNAAHGNYNSVNIKNTYLTWSIYVKPAELTRCALEITDNVSGGVSMNVNLTAQTFSVGIGSPTAFSNASGFIQALPNGWTLCTLTALRSNINTVSAVQLYPAASSGSIVFAGDGVSGLYIWGAQLIIGTTPKPYLRTTTNRLNVPKLDYSRGLGEPELLIEKVATNLTLRSQDFTNAIWTKSNITINPDIITAPDNTFTASKLMENTVNNQHFIQFSSSSSRVINDVYTYSVFLKASERSTVYFGINEANINFPSCIFNIVLGTIVSNSGISNPTIKPLGNDWYRVSITRTTAAAGSTYYQLNGVDGNNNTTYLGINNYGYYAWGFQAEIGSIATTYIPTTSVAVTRNADTNYIDLFNNNMLNPSAFTLYWEGYLYDGQPNAQAFVLSDTNTAVANTNQIGWYNKINPFYNISNINTSGSTGTTNNSFNKLAIQYSAGTANFYLNGVNVFPNRSVPVFNYRYLVLNSGSGIHATDKIILWSRTLNNSDCILLTTNVFSDNDVNNFILASGIFDGNQQFAINYLVTNLKSNNIWDKMQFIYPFIGGTAFTHKFNLKDPRDLNAAFRISFAAGVTHNSNGITGGANHNTFFNPSISCILGNTHWSMYSRTDALSSFRLVEVSASKGMQMFTRETSTGGNFLNDMYNDGGGGVTRTLASVPNNIGFFSASKIPTNFTYLHLNGVLKATNTNAVAGILPNGQLPFSSGGNLAFISMGLGLTNSESTILYNIVQQYQTLLGRQI